MAGGFVAVADDASGMRYNPGGIGFMELREATLMISQNYFGISNDRINQGYLAFVNPVPNWFDVSINGVFMLSERYTSINAGITLAKVFPIGENFRLSPGVSANLLTDSYSPAKYEGTQPDDPALQAGNSSVTAYGVDAGLMLRYQKVWGIGLSAENLNQPLISNNTGASDKLPMIGRVGVSYLYQDWLLGTLGMKMAMGDNQSDYDFNLGAEAWFLDHTIGLRGGGTQRELTLGGSYVATSLLNLQFDYAFSYPLSTVGQLFATTHRLSVTWRKEIPPPQYPDLQIKDEDLALSTPDIIKGQKIQVKAWIFNRGQIDSKAFTVSFWAETAGKAALLNPVREIEGLDKDDSVQVVFEWTAPDPGDYRFDFNVDDDALELPAIHGAVEELNEENNHAHIMAHVLRAPEAQIAASPDLLQMTEYTNVREERPIVPLVFFAENSDVVDARFDYTLEVIAKRILVNRSAKLVLYGYAGEQLETPLPAADAKTLALRRAENVKAAFLKKSPEIADRIEIDREHDFQAQRGGALTQVYQLSDIVLFGQENRRVEMKCVLTNEVDLHQDTPTGDIALSGDQIPQYRQQMNFNPDEVILLYGRATQDEANATDAAFERAVRGKQSLLKQLGKEYDSRIYILTTEPPVQAKAGVDLYLTGEGLIYRPAVASQTDAAIEVSSADTTIVTPKFVAEAGVRSWTVVIQDKEGQVIRNLASGNGPVPPRLVWDFKTDAKQWIEPNKDFTAKVHLFDTQNQEASAVSNPMHLQVVGVEREVQRLILVQFAFNQDKAESRFLESRVEYVARKIVSQVKELDAKHSLAIVVEGHTDNTGLFYRNDSLAIRRSNKEDQHLRRYMRYLLGLPSDAALAGYLHEHRVSLKPQGFADKKPYELTVFKNGQVGSELLGDNRYPEGRTINRRVMADIRQEKVFIP